jgi:uncharacterized protein (TIGR00255 family)
MPKSMTGFGRGEAESETYSVRAEVRSVNNRNLRVIFRMPELLQALEADFNKVMREAAFRGSVTVTFNLEDLSGDPGYLIDTEALRHYRDTLLKLDPEGNVPPASLVTLPGVLRKKTTDEVAADLGPIVLSALEKALRALVASRETEGRFIWEDMIARCAVIRKLLQSIESRMPAMVEEYRARLAERLGNLLRGVSAELTQDDLRKEIALFADRSDISEELTRMRSHLELMEGLGGAEVPIGRKLEFITQEMFREANTMTSKASEAAIVHDALDVKAEVEKLREQALNIE